MYQVSQLHIYNALSVWLKDNYECCLLVIFGVLVGLDLLFKTLNADTMLIQTVSVIPCSKRV